MNTVKSPFEITSVDVSDRAFNYGDGCFSTMLYIDGRIQLFEQHLQRLQHDTARLAISFSPHDAHALRTYLQSPRFISRLTFKTAAIKVFISRGTGGRGYAPPSIDNAQTKCIVCIHNYDVAAYHDGLNLTISSLILSSQPALAGLKHANRLEQVLAKQMLIEVNEHAINKYDDALLLDSNNCIIEATAANVFYYINHEWVTPNLSLSGVKGVMRDFVLNHLKQNDIKTDVRNVSMKDLNAATSAFLCNALTNIVPIKTVAFGEQVCEFDCEPSITLKKHMLIKLMETAHCVNS